MKHKTNRQVMKKAIQELDDITLAILRERILMVTETTLANREEVKEKMAKSFWHPESWLEHIQKIQNAFQFEDERPRESVIANAQANAFENAEKQPA
jgi:hypothetical protein